MKRFFLSLSLLSIAFALSAKENNTSFFAKITPADNKTDIAEGDSTVFSVWLYSTLPFDNIKCDNADFKISHCHVRKILNRQYRNQTRRFLNNRPYYCVLWAQYIVKGEKKGSYTFPSLSFSITQYKEIEQNIDPFDPFGFFRQPSYQKISQSCSSTTIKFNVVNTPLKTTEELIKSGKTII